MDDLAFELLEQILGQVVCDSNPSALSKTLRRCCLVSHTWKEIAQPLLFSTFTLYGRYYNLSRLYKTLSSYPYLQRPVKCIWVDLGKLSTGRALSVKAKPTIVEILRQVLSNPQVHDIVIQGYISDSDPDPSAATGFSSLVSTANITVLSFYNLLGCPIRILYQCPSVRELHFCESRFSGLHRDRNGGLDIDDKSNDLSQRNRSEDPSSSKSRPPLLRLYLESAESSDAVLLRWFLHSDCAFDISTLKTFHCLDMSNDITLFSLARSLVKRVSSSLEDIALDPPTYLSEGLSSIYPEYAMFDPLPQLRRLKLSLQQDDYINLWPWTMQLLSGLVNPERLEELQFPCTVPDNKAGGRAFRRGWEELDLFLTAYTTPSDEDLAGHRRFLNLRSIEVGVVHTYGDKRESRLGFFQEELPSLVPRLRKLGILKTSHSNSLGFVKDSDCWYGAP